jgi:hypothetical protein
MDHANVLARQGFSIGTGLFESAPGERIVLPFRRAKVAMLVIALMALVMTVPAVGVFSDAASNWSELDGLFGLTTALFLTGWLLGWSTGLFILYALLATLCFGRETLVLRPGAVEIRFGLPFLFIRFRLDPGRISGMRHHVPEPRSGTSWRGPHLAFDYDGKHMEIGSDLTPAAADRLAGRIRALPAASAANPPGNYISPPQVAMATGQDADAARPPPVLAQSGALPVSTLVLVAANLVPVAGVLLFDWDLGKLMVLFWAESGIIGFYNLLKMAVVQRWAVLFSGPFFIGHFGAFMAVHFLFVYELFVARATGADSALAEVGRFLFTLWPALLALLLSHGLSFFYNFLGQGEYRGKSMREQMAEPYGRVMIMHVTVIVGGGLSLMLGSPDAALLLLVALKVAADVTAHRKQHRPGSGPD